MKKIVKFFLPVLVVILFCQYGAHQPGGDKDFATYFSAYAREKEERGIPSFSRRKPVHVMNDNVPDFAGVLGDKDFVEFSPLDELGRCGPALACIGPDTLSAEPGTALYEHAPAGWHNVTYENLAHGHLYESAFLISPRFSLKGLPQENVITGTWYLNNCGLKPYEDKVAAYIEETGHHVLYRATPVFIPGELIAQGIKLEAMSVEDGGAGLSFHVFCHNVQPGVDIDYKTGDSRKRLQKYE